MADDIGKWVDEAKAERAKAETGATDHKRKPPPREEPPTSTPPDDERIEVYRALHSASLWKDLALVVPAAVVAVIAMIAHAPPRVVLPIVGGLVLVFVVIRVATYKKEPTFEAFRRWRRELPFELLGWPRLVDADHFVAKKSNDYDYWRSGSIAITVDAAAASGGATEAIDAVLVLFCKQANTRFYDFKAQTVSSPDPRTKWTSDGLCVKGSINAAVAYDIYWDLLRRLEVVARTRGSITRVVITADPRERQVKGFEDHTVGWSTD